MNYIIQAAIELQNQAASYHRCSEDFLEKDGPGARWLSINWQKDAARCSAIARGLMGIDGSPVTEEPGFDGRATPKIFSAYDAISDQWFAYRDGSEETGVRGWGWTKQEAIDDLLDIEV